MTTTLFSIVVLALTCSSLVVAQEPGQVIWKYDLKSDSKGSGAVADLDGDGRPDIVFGTYFGDERLHALDGATGNLKWEHASDGGPFDASVTIVDLDDDSDQDGFLDAFLVVGRGYSGEGEFGKDKNRGTAMVVRLGNGVGPGWRNFRGNHFRNGRPGYSDH